MDLVSEANSLAQNRMMFYGVVERHFINSYFAMLLVNGLTADLPKIIRDNPIFAGEENDTGTWVFHIGSVKLILNDNVDIAVHVHTTEGQRCGLMVYIWQTYADAILTAEFQLVGDLGRTTMFKVPLPETLGHPLFLMLVELKRIITHGGPNTVGARLKTWAEKQK